MTPPDRSSDAPDTASDLSGFEVVVAVCGGIAAYKTATLVSSLVQRGAGVSVVMTSAAQRFITPLTFESLTGRPVITSLWEATETHDPQHLRLSEAADLLVIAPATANMIGKIAGGIADDLVSTLVMSATGPVLLAPAMNTRMWENPIVRENLQSLKDRGYAEVPPEAGWLACRTIGVGRMAEPATILDAVVAQLRNVETSKRRNRNVKTSKSQNVKKSK
ncbi:MAG: bifunctional phosphopantothenoylcysteine decarboxylase/phosphopantothenate--cysteine ligase CoaBC [Phycisphaerae bacterium]